MNNGVQNQTVLRDRVGALILRAGKILLVTGHGKKIYWTPGGKIDDGEEKVAALRREIEEELGVEVLSSKYYFTLQYYNERQNGNQKCDYFITEIGGELNPAREVTGYHWFSKDDIFKQTIPTTVDPDEALVQKLIADDLLK